MAITRSMKKGHEPPVSNDNQSSDVRDARKKTSKSRAPGRRRVAQEKSVDRLTALPLELFKMIMEELVRDISRVTYQFRLLRWNQRDKLTHRIDQAMNIRFVSRLFWAEFTSAIFKEGRPVNQVTQVFWCHLEKAQPLLISRLLLEESLTRPNSDIGILALIQQTVEKLLHLQPDGSTLNRRAFFEAACSCISHARHNVSVSTSLVRKKSETYGSYGPYGPYATTTFEEDVVNSCWALASWMGYIPLMNVLESEHGPLARRTGDRQHPRFMGSVQWAAARNGHTDMIKYLQQKGCDFGQRWTDYFDHLSPLCGALNGNHAQAFEDILPAYDKYIIGPGYNAVNFRMQLNREVAINGSGDLARMLWTREPLMDEKDLSEALVEVCSGARQDKEIKATILIQAGASVNKYCDYSRTTPLEAAVTAGSPEFLDFLLRHGGDPNTTVVERHRKSKKGYRSDPLIKAVDEGKTDALSVLLQHCKWHVATKANLLLKAVNKNCLDMVKLVATHFDSKSSRRAVNMGRAAVRQARANLKTEIVDVLLAHGCEE